MYYDWLYDVCEIRPKVYYTLHLISLPLLSIENLFTYAFGENLRYSLRFDLERFEMLVKDSIWDLPITGM